MPQDAGSLALAAVGALFLVFLVVKSRYPLVPASHPERAEARRRILEAKRRAQSPALTPAQRAQAWREAAQAALQGKNPSLAASFALRAEKLEPGTPESVGLLAVALRRAARFRALERFLWRLLAATEQGDGYERAYDELIALYDGPLRRPERAVVLRRLRAPRPSARLAG